MTPFFSFSVKWQWYNNTYICLQLTGTGAHMYDTFLMTISISIFSVQCLATMVQQPAVWNVYSSKGQGHKCVTENLWLSPFLFSVLGVLRQWYNNPQCEMSTAQKDRGINVWQRIYDYHHFYFQCSVSCDNGTTTRSVKCLQLKGTGV